MRLFTGIALAPNALDRLSALLTELRPKAQLKWSPIENLHITCKFIGEWPDERLPELRHVLDTIVVTGPIPVTISRFGFFPNPHRPHSFFAGVQARPGLADLAAGIDRVLGSLGIAAEARPFQPHVTLARVRPTSDIRGLREHIAGMADFDFGAFPTRNFHLYQSEPTPGGSVYTKLATYDLMRETATTS